METRKKGQHSWFNVLRSLQESEDSYLHMDHPYAAKMGGMYRVFVGRRNKPATTKGSYGLMFGDESTIQHKKSQNHAGVYDFMTLGLPWVVESSFRGNWITRETPRTIVQVIGSPMWVPLNVGRATFGMACMSVAALPTTIYHFSSSDQEEKQKNKPSKQSVVKEENHNKKQDKFLKKLQSLNELDEEANFWEIKKGSSYCHPVYGESSKHYAKIISHVKKDELPESLQELVQDKKTYKHYVKLTEGQSLHIWKRKAVDDEKRSEKCAYVPSRLQK